MLDKELTQIVYNLEILLNTIYPDIKNFTQRNFNLLCSRTIVSPRNDSANEINKMIIEKVPDDFICYKFINSMCNTEDTLHTKIFKFSQSFRLAITRIEIKSR